MALRENKEGSGEFLRATRRGANLGQVGRLSSKVKDLAGVEDTDFVRAQIHKVELLF